MKKILLVLIALLGLIVPNIKAYALEDSFYTVESIKNEYIRGDKDGENAYRTFRLFRRKSDGRFAYSIQVWGIFYGNDIYSGYDDKQNEYANISSSTWDKIVRIAYYGYGYPGHTDNKWYAITQFMIWQTVSPEAGIYFTKILNGDRVDKYQDEMDEINTLITKKADIPSFYNQTYQVKYNETMTITDTNNVFLDFEITNTSDLEVSRDSNTLSFSKSTPGKSQIYFSSLNSRFTSSPIVYISDSEPNLLLPGNYYPNDLVVNVELPSNNVVVNLLANDKFTSTFQGDAKLEGSTFQLLDRNNEVIKEENVDKDGILTFENVGYGSYYLKEIKSGVGYLLNQDTILVEVDENINTINFYNQVIQNKVIIKNYLKNPLTNETKALENAKYGIYNSNNEKIMTVDGDENGITELTLPYGTYTVKQESGVKNYYYANDVSIDVKEDGITQTFELYNEELTANIRIVNVDSDSSLPILEKGSIFKITNLSTLNDTLLETNNLGNTNINLSSGSYQIEQIAVVDGYNINTNTFTLEISDDIEFNTSDDNNLYLEIVIPNNKKIDQIDFNKINSIDNINLQDSDKDKDIDNKEESVLITDNIYQTETIINVPNTYLKKFSFSNINSLLILVGIILIKKEKEYEN